MGKANLQGYMRKILRVDLTNRRITEEIPEEEVLRKYLGGTGLGAYYLYKEVIPGVEWSDPENRLVFATGPINGTSLGGSGSFMVVTKGPLTNGAASAEANGFLGAYLKFCGFDGVVVQGVANELCYLYIHDGGAEIKSAAYLAGKDTWEVERLIKEELGKTGRRISVFSIGVAGENLVEFACIVGDKGHVAAHNGVGAVMGCKKLKAIAVERGKRRIPLSDKERVSALSKRFFEKTTELDPALHYKWGTLGTDDKAEQRLLLGYLPIKNYTTNTYPQGARFSAQNLRSQPQFHFVRHPCWACRFRHCQLIKIVEGPYAGYEGEELDFEPAAGFGPLIGNADWDGMVVLANDADRLGIDANESGWLIAWLMECFEKGLVTKKTTGGLSLSWGNVEAARAMLHRIANRKEFGDVLAEGVKSAAKRLGGEAQRLAVFTERGNTPRMHDHRSSWPMLIDTVTSDRGRDMDATWAFGPEYFTPEVAAETVAGMRGRFALSDCLVVCKFNIIGLSKEELVELLNAATGWNFTTDEEKDLGLRVANLLRAFNVRHGHTRSLEAPSTKYGSAPVDGPAKGKSIARVWDQTLDHYYASMGWDTATGKPLPDTLKRLGLEYTIPDIWQQE